MVQIFGQSRSGAGRAGRKAAMVMVVAVALLADLVFVQAVLGGAFRVQLHVRMTLAEAMRFLGTASGAGQLNATYGGSFRAEFLGRGTDLSITMPMTARLLKNGTASRTEIDLTMPRIANDGYTGNFSYLVMENATGSYFCGEQPSGSAWRQNGSYRCMSGKDIGITANAAQGAEHNLTSVLNDINVTFEWLSPGLYEGVLCGLITAGLNWSGIGTDMVARQAADTALPGLYPEVWNASSLTGSFTTCISASGIPLFIRSNAAASLPHGRIDMSSLMNET